MNVTVEPDETEEMLGCEVSDEALETAACTSREFAVRYTLLYCTAQDCALLS